MVLETGRSLFGHADGRLVPGHDIPLNAVKPHFIKHEGDPKFHRFFGKTPVPVQAFLVLKYAGYPQEIFFFTPFFRFPE